MNIFKKIVDEKCFALQQDINTWQDAVRLGCDMLEKTGSVTGKYYEGIIESTKANGPYYAVAPGFAMPHTRPENGVIKTGLSLVTIKGGVNFGADTDPIEVVLIFAAKDKKEMNEVVIVQIMEFLEDESLFEKIKNAHTEADLLACGE